jgi:hypothetical protein
MAWQVIFSARGRNDLEQIVKHIARDNPAAAERFGLKLVEQAESLGAVAAKSGHKILSCRFISDHLSTGCKTARRAHSAVLACSTPRASGAIIDFLSY